MNKSKFKLVILLMIFIFLITSTLNVCAETNQEKLKRIQNEISVTKGKISKLKTDINALVKETNKIDKNIDELEAEIDELNDKIQVTQENLDKTEQELKEAEAERIEHKKIADERIKVMYMYGGTDYLEILFSAKSISDLVSRIDAVKILTNHDKGIFDKLLSIEKEIENKKQKIEEEKNALVQLKQDAEKTISVQLVAKQQKQELMDAMHNDKESLEAILDQEEADAYAVQQLILAEMGQDRDFKNQKGYYLWPTPGYKHITSSFGYRIHPVTKTKKFHAGVDIGASNKSKIISPGNGVVILAQYYGGYGNTVIIDMGGGISMLFGHCSSLKVSKGSYVTAGQIIAYVGSTGVSTGPHLHFEVRKNGSPINPMEWVIY